MYPYMGLKVLHLYIITMI